jgi:hypothetical protein
MRWKRAVLSAALPLAVFVLPAESSAAIGIAAAGGYAESVSSSSLSAGPGSDIISHFDSPSGATVVDVTGCVDGADAWRVDVRLQRGSFDAGTRVLLKRTSDGAGAGSISGGTDFIEAVETDTEFFSGTGDRTNVCVQYRLEGLSVGSSQGPHSADVLITVVDIL